MNTFTKNYTHECSTPLFFQVQLMDRKVYAFLSATTGAGENAGKHLSFPRRKPLISIKDLTVPACPHTCAGNAVQHASIHTEIPLSALGVIYT